MYPVSPVEKGERVRYKSPDPAFYEALGDDGIKDLMYRFYDIVYDSSIAHFFPQGEDEFEQVKMKNTDFFIQICGGPKVYENQTDGMSLDEYMIRLHDDFSINEKARYEWLGCMEDALVDTKIDQKLKDNFWEYLENFSKLTVNRFKDGSTYYAAFHHQEEN